MNGEPDDNPEGIREQKLQQMTPNLHNCIEDPELIPLLQRPLIPQTFDIAFESFRQEIIDVHITYFLPFFQKLWIKQAVQKRNHSKR